MRNTKQRNTRVGNETGKKRVVTFGLESLERRELLAWGLYPQLMDLDQLVAKYPTIDGRGVAIADIDSGLSMNHPSLAGRIWTNPGEIPGNKIDDDGSGKVDDVNGWDFVGNDNSPTDDQGHGTYTAGVLVAKRWNNWGNGRGYSGDHADYQGVATGAKVIPLKVIDGNLQYTAANVEKALQWVIKNHRNYNIVAVNLSLHVGDDGNTLINDEMKTLWDAGVFVGASSGNWASITNDFAMPAGGAYAMSVGALDNSGLLAGITCRGSALDLVAPGEGPYLSRSADYNYGTPATSFATPMATGAAALLKQINPAFTSAQLHSILRDSASNVYDPITKLNYKALDLDNAVALGLSRAGTPAPPPAPAPSTQSPFGGNPISLPGVIELENFDNGGQGVAYNDSTTTNLGNAGRAGGVDMQTNTDSAGAINLGWTKPGEWLEYTVTIPTAGTYDLSARVASSVAGGNFHVELDGANKSGTMTIPATGGYNTWTTINKRGISLPSGQHVLRVALDSLGANSNVGNLNWIKFTRVTTTSLTVQAESASAVSGITKSATNLSYVDGGDWAQYKGLNLGTGVSNFAVRIAVAAVNAGRQIQVRQGSITGKILGTLTVKNTGGYGIFQEQSIAISPISGVQDIYLTFSGGAGVGNIDSFRFW